MDMQNVTDLTISEGTVRTIHDSSDRLLWGKLSYNTYYAGDTTQQSYSGKNKLAYSLAQLKSVNISGTWTDNEYSFNGVTYTVNGDLTITGNGTATGTSYLILTNSLTLTSSENYILNGSPTGGSVSTYSIRLYDGGNYQTEHGSGLSFTYGTQNLVRINVSNGTQINNLIFEPMIRLASETSSVYEQYVGGIPAPNPDYPQAVNVVTGEQTITINGEAFTLNLGSTELCKIGNYQDYIYKSGNDWYVHKETTKYVYSDSSQTAYFDSSFPRASFNRPSGIVGSADTTYCNQFIYGDTETTNDRFNFSSTRVFVRSNEKMISATDWNSWMGQNPVIFYFALTTPTDTKITDTTLLTQLNDINECLTRYGYNYIVSGNLPLIIIQNNL